MLDLNSIHSITLDAADTYSDGALQDQAAELIMRMLSQNYQIYVFSSNPKHPVTSETFEHPALQFLREPMPPAPALAAKLTDLVSPGNLWITDDPGIAKWLIEKDLPLATRKVPPVAGGRRILRYRTLGELAASMDPTARVLREAGRLVAGQGEGAPDSGNARVICIGGPPLAGQAELALRLKHFLESLGYPLVELLDLSALHLGSTTLEVSGEVTGRNADGTPGHWLREQLERMHAGEPVFAETLPEGLPQAFEPHLPLFWSPETVLIAFGEMVLAPPLIELFDVTILLENTPAETTRRVYEIDDDRFDAKFTEQYLQREGKAYERYLAEYRVREFAMLRVDANTPGAYFLVGLPPSAEGVSSS